MNALGSGLTLQRFNHSRLLVHLGLAMCRLTHLDKIYLPNLHSLDVSDNLLHELVLRNLTSLHQLKTLVAAGNPLTFSTYSYQFPNTSNPLFEHLSTLDLSRVSLPRLDLGVFRYYSELRVLNLSGCAVESVVGDGIQLPLHVHTIDVRGCPMSVFTKQMLRGLAELEYLYTDTYKLCCEQALPRGFNIKSCTAPENDISSCDFLLASALFRVGVAVMALVGLCSNLAALTMQVSRWRSLKAAYGVFFCNLCVSGLMAGSYHAVLGTAGWLLEGSYLWRDTWWTHSTVCQLTAFLWMLSLQTSLLFVTLLTLHSFLLLRFPGSKIHFSSLSARLISGCVWACACVFTAMPWIPARNKALPTTTAICVPLSFHVNDNTSYTASVVTLKSFLFVTVMGMQMSISSYVQSKSFAFIGHKTCTCQILTKETLAAGERCQCEIRMDIAGRFSGIVSTWCLCWLPVPVVVAMVSSGHHVSAQVSVTIQLLLLPFTPAASPLLYGVDVIKERRRHTMQNRLMKRVGRRTQ